MKKIDLLISEIQAVKAAIERLGVSSEYLSTAQLATRTGKSRATILKWIRRGWIKARRTRGRAGPHQVWAVSERELARLLRHGPRGDGESPGPAPCPKRPKTPPKAPPMRKELEYTGNTYQ